MKSEPKTPFFAQKVDKPLLVKTGVRAGESQAKSLERSHKAGG